MKRQAPPKTFWHHLCVEQALGLILNAAFCPCDARRHDDISLLPLESKFAFHRGRKRLSSQCFLKAISMQMIAFIPCAPCGAWVEMNTQPEICEHRRGKTHSRHRAPLMAHWGEIAGFLPHRDLLQVLGSYKGELPLHHTSPDIMKSDL